MSTIESSGAGVDPFAPPCTAIPISPFRRDASHQLVGLQQSWQRAGDIGSRPPSQQWFVPVQYALALLAASAHPFFSASSLCTPTLRPMTPACLPSMERTSAGAMVTVVERRETERLRRHACGCDWPKAERCASVCVCDSARDEGRSKPSLCRRRALPLELSPSSL